MSSTNNNQSKIINFKKFDPSQITFGPVLNNDNKGLQVYMKYGDMEKMVIQTPLMHAPFGVSDFEDKTSKQRKFGIDLSFKGMKDDPKVQQFHDKLAELDEHMVQMGMKNSMAWLEKKNTAGLEIRIKEDMYRFMVKQAKEPEKYAATFKAKILTKADAKDYSVPAFVYNTTGEVIPFDLKDTKKGAKIQLICEAAPMWIVNKKTYGITWRVVKARVQQPEGDAYSFIDSDDEEDEGENFQEDGSDKEGQ
jgi:hypothetical protein